MDQQKFWRRLFARYVEGESQPAERKLLDQFELPARIIVGSTREILNIAE